MTKFKVGDKVRVLVGYDKGYQGFVEHVNNEEVGYLSTRDDCHNTRFEYELELIATKENKLMTRRTFRLLKETPTLKKGALYQEACDDGTQPYDLMDATFHKGGESTCISDRLLVEEAPEWFVEVFKVEPEFMTREELDRYEAFLKGDKRSVGRPKGSTKKVSKNSSYWTDERKAAQAKRMKKIRAARKGNWGTKGSK